MKDKKKNKKYPSEAATEINYSIFSEEALIKILKELTTVSSKNEREFIVYSGCRTYGMIQLGKQCCSDPECDTCTNFHEALQEESKKLKDEEE
tara:strand:+ start:1006 stop:1284 length:279 start_codon:yes stop_codon:yes gene_type:complete